MHKQQDLIDFRERGNLATLTDLAGLNEKSKVWEIGVWRGNWIKEIVSKYNPYIMGFEPMPQFFFEALKKFSNNHKIDLMPYGLSDRNGFCDVCLASDSTGVFAQSGEKVKIQLRNINEVIAENRIENVDLMSCNCEGGEYFLLPALCESGNISKFNFIQIQYHYYEPENITQMYEIRNMMSKTHRLRVAYDFIWEIWERI